MKPPMNHTAYKLLYTRNVYGDFIASGTTELKCHFRYITEQITDSSNQTIQSDAMAWFEPDSGIEKQDIVQIDGENFRVERIVKARRLRNPNVLFLKCDLLKYGAIS